MPRNGSGIYSRAVTPPVNGDVASATDFNTEVDDIGDELSDSINRNGTRAFAANQPMGGYKLTGLAAGSVNGDSVRYEQLTALSGTYQPLDADLTAIAALGYTSGEYLIKKTAADTWALITITTAGAALLDDADAAAQRTTMGVTAANLGLGTSDSPQFTAINLGHANDTTIARVSAGVISVEGATVYTSGNLPGTAITWTAAIVSSVGSGGFGYRLYNASAGTNEKYWSFNVNTTSGEFQLFAANDAFNAGAAAISVTRSGTTVTGINLAATSVQVNGKAALSHAGSYTSGQVTVQSGGSPSGGSDGDIVLIY